MVDQEKEEEQITLTFDLPLSQFEGEKIEEPETGDEKMLFHLEEEVKDKNEMEKIILCEVQNKIYPNIEKIFLNLLKDSGYPVIKIEKKIDFEKLYNQKKTN